MARRPHSSMLKNLGDDLVDLHGPHDHQSLLSPEKTAGLLDSFARAEEQLENIERIFANYSRCSQNMRRSSTAETAREQELDLLRHQMNEITAANLVAGEEEEIEERYRLASNSKRLIELATAVATTFRSGRFAFSHSSPKPSASCANWKRSISSMAEFSSAHAASVIELSEIARALVVMRRNSISIRNSSRARAARFAIRNIEAQIWRLDRGRDRLRRARGRADAENRRARCRAGASRKRNRECPRANESRRRSVTETTEKGGTETFRKHPAQSSRSGVPPIGIRSKA